MRVAFTGKGGSGKSTVAALFVDHLRARTQRVLAIDADINVHLAGLLGIRAPQRLALSAPDNVSNIRRHLIGANPLIVSVDQFVKTTPPGPGSNLVHLAERDPVIAHYATPVENDVYFMHVGTYEAEDIGTSCYHVNLAILENLLSHVHLDDDDWIICDMVAGTDAFSNSLHAQFDTIVVVVEPTPESVGVARKYHELATAAGTVDTIVFVGNKVDSANDLAYLEDEIGSSVLSSLPMLAGLRRARQRGDRPSIDDIGSTTTLEAIEKFALTSPMTPQRRTMLLRELHLRLARENWVQASLGDITTQLPETAS